MGESLRDQPLLRPTICKSLRLLIETTNENGEYYLVLYHTTAMIYKSLAICYKNVGCILIESLECCMLYCSLMVCIKFGDITLVMWYVYISLHYLVETSVLMNILVYSSILMIILVY